MPHIIVMHVLLDNLKEIITNFIQRYLYFNLYDSGSAAVGLHSAVEVLTAGLADFSHFQPVEG